MKCRYLTLRSQSTLSFRILLTQSSQISPREPRTENRTVTHAEVAEVAEG